MEFKVKEFCRRQRCRRRCPNRKTGHLDCLNMYQICSKILGDFSDESSKDLKPKRRLYIEDLDLELGYALCNNCNLVLFCKIRVQVLRVVGSQGCSSPLQYGMQRGRHRCMYTTRSLQVMVCVSFLDEAFKQVQDNFLVKEAWQILD